MEIDGDGDLDILSGSYSRKEGDMAGLFQVLRGNKDGTFRTAEVLKGSDGEPLIISGAGGDEGELDDICTRPTAVDLDGDGKLDIVSGNFAGTFAFFRGEGSGKFAPKSTWLETDGERLAVEHHSDPFFVDWDKDGDLDLLSGSSAGGVFLFTNAGTKTAPKFAARKTLLEPAGHGSDDTKLGDAHVQGPQNSTRVWADDVDGDGKLDLLVGDTVRLLFPAKGVDDAKAIEQLRVHSEKQQALFAKMTNGGETPSQAAMDALHKELEALDVERDKFVRDEMTGFVWLLVQR